MSVTLLAASADDTRLAYIHGGRLVLCDARALTELAATDAPEGARQLLFIGPPSRLLIATEDELFTYELATMTVLGRRTVASGARVAAVVDNRAVLWLPAGPAIALARFLDDAIDVHALDTSGPPVDVAPLEQQQALVITALRNEVVDLISRRVMARLHIALPPPPRLLGGSGGLRFLWTAAVGGRELTIIRLSDGRTFPTELPAPIRQVLSASTSSWLVVQTDDGLVRVHVVTQAVHRVDADLGRGACVGGAADAGLYWIDPTWRLRRTSLAGDAVVATAGGPLRLSFAGLDDGRPTPAATVAAPPSAPAVSAPSPTTATAPIGGPAPLAPAVPSLFAQLEPSAPAPRAPTVDAAPLFVDPPPVRAGGWTGPLIAAEPINAAPVAPVAPPPPSHEAATTTPRPPSRLDDRVRRAGLRAARADLEPDAPPPPPAPTPAASAPALDPVAAPAAYLAAPPTPAAPAPSAAAPAPPELPEERVDADLTGPTVAGLTPDARPVRSWRMQCAAWARQLLAGRDQLEPSFVGTPLGLLARRAHLDADGARALALLYGAWLLGRPGQPLARVARAVTWDELAGRGSLPEAGLHTVRAGRAAIRPTVARFLDGARARRMTVHGLRPRTNLGAGLQLVRCTTAVALPAAAQAVADHLGAAAVIDERGARGRRQLAIALDEAWLRAVPAVIIPGAELDASAIAAARLRKDHTVVVIWPDSIVPEPFEHLPVIAL